MFTLHSSAKLFNLEYLRFAVCVSVDGDSLDLFLNGEQLLGEEDRDISAVKGWCKYTPGMSKVLQGTISFGLVSAPLQKREIEQYPPQVSRYLAM